MPKPYKRAELYTNSMFFNLMAWGRPHICYDQDSAEWVLAVGHLTRIDWIAAWHHVELASGSKGSTGAYGGDLGKLGEYTSFLCLYNGAAF